METETTEAQGAETVSLTKAQLAQVLARWEADARQGAWEVELGLTPNEIGERNADYLWTLLQALP